MKCRFKGKNMSIMSFKIKADKLSLLKTSDFYIYKKACFSDKSDKTCLEEGN